MRRVTSMLRCLETADVFNSPCQPVVTPAVITAVTQLEPTGTRNCL